MLFFFFAEKQCNGSSTLLLSGFRLYLLFVAHVLGAPTSTRTAVSTFEWIVLAGGELASEVVSWGVFRRVP